MNENENKESRSERLLEILGDVDDAYIAEARPAKKPARRLRLVLIAAAAAALIAAVTLVSLNAGDTPAPAENGPEDEISLSGASVPPESEAESFADTSEEASGEPSDPEGSQPGIAVYTLGDNAAAPRDRLPTASDLPRYTLGQGSEPGEATEQETEIFAASDNIFSGKVTAIENRVAEYGGLRFGFAVVTVEVAKTFRGEAEPGSTVTVFNYAPIIEGASYEHNEIAEKLEVGSTAMFLTRIAGEDRYAELNGERLYIAGQADYEMPDGLRFLFVQNGSITEFAKYCFNSASDALIFREIEKYVAKMIAAAE